jgi:hypothetical protein
MEDKSDTPLWTSIDENAPALQFQYLYKYSFPTIAIAYLKKFNWESKTNLSTFTGAQ